VWLFLPPFFFLLLWARWCAVACVCGSAASNARVWASTRMTATAATGTAFQYHSTWASLRLASALSASAASARRCAAWSRGSMMRGVIWR
jgi:hypothetical protein